MSVYYEGGSLKEKHKQKMSLEALTQENAILKQKMADMQEEADSTMIDHEYRLSLLELGVSDA